MWHSSGREIWSNSKYKVFFISYTMLWWIMNPYPDANIYISQFEYNKSYLCCPKGIDKKSSVSRQNKVWHVFCDFLFVLFHRLYLPSCIQSIMLHTKQRRYGVTSRFCWTFFQRLLLIHYLDTIGELLFSIVSFAIERFLCQHMCMIYVYNNCSLVDVEHFQGSGLQTACVGPNSNSDLLWHVWKTKSFL